MGYKKLYQQTMLAMNGLVDRIENMQYTNPIIANSETEKEYSQFLEIWDRIENVNKYIWNGLPINLTGQQLESLLYQWGSLCIFEDENGQLVFSPYATTGRLNEYGLLDEITPITLDGKTHKKKYNVIMSENAKPKEDERVAVILNDYTGATSITPVISRQVVNKATIKPQVQAHIQLMCAIAVSAKKALALCESEEQKKVITKQLENLLDPSKPIVAVSSQRNKNGSLDLPVEMFNIATNIAISEYTNAIDYYDRTRRHFNGINAPDTYAKKERLITSETEDANTHTSIGLYDGLKQRQEAIKLFTMYAKNPNNKNITCNINTLLQPKEEKAENNEEINDSGENENDV